MQEIVFIINYSFPRHLSSQVLPLLGSPYEGPIGVVSSTSTPSMPEQGRVAKYSTGRNGLQQAVIEENTGRLRYDGPRYTR